jgi:hypothetical protein
MSTKVNHNVLPDPAPPNSGIEKTTVDPSSGQVPGGPSPVNLPQPKPAGGPVIANFPR